MRQWSLFFLAFVIGGVAVGNARAELIAYYPFDEDVDDHSGNENHGEIFGGVDGAGPGSGYDGVGAAHAFGFDEPGRVVIPVNIDPEELPQLTVTMWVKADESIISEDIQLQLGHHPKVFGHDDGGWDRSFGLDNRITCCAPEEFRWAIFTGGAGPGPTEIIDGSEVTDEWTFLAAVWDADAETVSLHVNDLSTTEPYLPTFSAWVDSSIGSLRPDNFNEPWVGFIDEVQIFDTVLTQAEIDAIRTGGGGELTGDFNENGELDVADLDLLATGMMNNDASFDLDGDSDADVDDRLTWINELAKTWAGDSNFDGEFGSGDLVAVFQAGKFETGNAATWAEGDWNGDKVFGTGDLVFAFQAGGFEQGPRAATASVPEPGGSLLLLLGLVGVGFGYRR